MTNAAFGKKVLAIAVLACLCAALIAVPAYGFYYVHDDSVSDSSDGLGSYEVFMVVDETAVGGDVHSDLMFVPAGSTADVVLTEGIISSQNVSGAYTAPVKGDGSTVLDRYDNVVITVTK